MVWRERLKIEDRLEQHLRDRELLTPARQWAINQARFETARSAWRKDREIALKADEAIRKSGGSFHPSGASGPASYRALYSLFGFEMAERIADATRSVRKAVA
jgi:hypothetical protein